MRKVRSLVTVLGIVLGVMSIMVVLAILNGMNKSTMEWMQERGGLNKVEIQRNWNYDFRQGGDASFSLNDLQKIKAMIPEARAFNPLISQWNSVARFQDKSYVAESYGAMPDMLVVENWQAAKGRFISDIDIRENANVIVLGSTAAKEIFGHKNPIGQSLMMGSNMLTVIGVLQEKAWNNPGGGSFGGNAMEYLNRRMFVPLSTMMYKIQPGSRISSVDILAENPEAALKLQKKLEGIVLNITRGKRMFRVASAQEDMQQMKKSSGIFSAIFIQIGVISLLVGGIVIMNIMLASIKERTREIGVRLAIGARRFDIFIQFMVQTILITGLGGIFGIALGFSILGVVSGYLQIPMQASPNMIYTALAVSIGVGLVFGIAPAVKASKLDPVVALREE